MKTYPLILASLTFSLLAGCVAAPGYLGPNKIYADAMQARLQYRGFSLARPVPRAWYTLVREQNHTDAIFRRDLPPGTHTAYVSVSLRTLPQVANSEADFARLARQDRVEGEQRFTVLSYRQKTVQVQGQWAVEYDVTLLDKGGSVAVGHPFVVHNCGQVIRHPTFPNGVVITTFSERGSKNELSPGIQAEGKNILQGVRLEFAPGRALS